GDAGGQGGVRGVRRGVPEGYRVGGGGQCGPHLPRLSRRLEACGTISSVMEAIKPDTGAAARPERPAVAERSAVYRSFWRKVDQALNSVEEEQALTSSLDEMLRILLKEFGQDLGFVAGSLYAQADVSYVLRRWFGYKPTT